MISSSSLPLQNSPTFKSVTWTKANPPKKPSIVTNHVASCGLHSTDIMRALKKSAKMARAGHDLNMGLWLDGRAAQWDYLSWLPVESDNSFEEYVNRVILGSKSTSFCFSLFNLQCFEDVIWKWGQTFSRLYTERVGLPSGEVDIDVFLGRYSVTPRGIHRDPADTLMFVLEGSKRLMFWPEEYFQGHIFSKGKSGSETLVGIRIEDYIDDAISIEAKAGDVIYWPSDYWHVGYQKESHSEVSMAMNIGFHRKTECNTVGAINDLLMTISNRIHRNENEFNMDDQSFIAPTEKAILDLLANGVVDTPAADMLRWSKMKFLSSCGFLAVPNLKNIEWDMEDSGNWQLVFKGALITYRTNAREVEVAANGHLETFYTDEILSGILEKLKNGETVYLSFQEKYTRIWKFLKGAGAIIPA